MGATGERTEEQHLLTCFKRLALVAVGEETGGWGKAGGGGSRESSREAFAVVRSPGRDDGGSE